MSFFHVFITIGCSLISIIIGIVIRKFYVDWVDSRKSKLIKFSSNRSIDINILRDLRIGMSLENIKFLGIPHKKYNSDSTVFKDNTTLTNSYVYLFKNAYLKITSVDNQSIDSITLFPKNKKFDFKGFDLGLNLNSSKLNKAKVNKKLVAECEHTMLITKRDYSFGLKYSILSPLYIDVTFFGTCIKNWHEYFDTKNPNLFLGKEIEGICITSNFSPAYFIHLDEII